MPIKHSAAMPKTLLNPKKSAIRRVSVPLIRQDGGTQARVAVDQMIVDDYASAYRIRATFPPIVVYHDGDAYWLADGFHRLLAALQGGQKSILAEIRTGTRRDAILHAAGANAGHGVRRSSADKRRAVGLLLADPEWRRWSDREIARKCHVHHDLVGDARREIAASASGGSARCASDERLACRNGTTYPIRPPRVGSGSRIAADVRAAIRDTPLADKPAEVKRLAGLDIEAQRAVAAKLRSGAARSVRQAGRQIEAEAIDRELPSLPDGSTKYRLLVADPPWPYQSRMDDATKRGVVPYPVMSLNEIKVLSVAELAHDDSVLFLWITNAFVEEGFAVARAWGFRPVTLLTWVKPRMGTGDWLRGASEHAIMAVRGRPVVRLTNQSTVLHAPVPRRHSTKPPEAYALFEGLVPAGKDGRLELFGRATREGWTSWGRSVVDGNASADSNGKAAKPACQPARAASADDAASSPTDRPGRRAGRQG
jgi:N6-adenosine-specific RNA methylase IME4/ParB-like chromosome segregation protein Spo0J